MSKLWCIKCEKELAGVEMSIFSSVIGSSGTIYCKNDKCTRYGLVTAIYLEEQTTAPKTAKSNAPKQKESSSE